MNNTDEIHTLRVVRGRVSGGNFASMDNYHNPSYSIGGHYFPLPSLNAKIWELISEFLLYFAGLQLIHACKTGP